MSVSFVFVSLSPPSMPFSLSLSLFYASLPFSLCLFSHSSLSVPSFSLLLFFALCLFFPHPIRFFLFLPIFISLFFIFNLSTIIYTGRLHHFPSAIPFISVYTSALRVINLCYIKSKSTFRSTFLVYLFLCFV